MTIDSNVYTQAGLQVSQGATIKETGVSTIDQTGFLRLMTTQLQYQDPFEPMDNNQMVQQMATFSSLENQNKGNSYLENINEALSGTRLSDAAGWIGKSMLVESSIATPDRAGSYAGELTLPADADSVTVDLLDSTGKVLKSIDLGAREAGAASFYWDGTNDAGELVGGGPLSVRVRGASPSQVATWASIAAVQSPASGTNAQLITPLGNFYPNDALRLG